MGGNGGGLITSATLVNGVATSSAFFEYAGKYNSIYAKYSGDSNYAAANSIGSPGGVQSVSIIAQTITSTTLTANPTPSVAGQSVVLTAHVTPALASGDASNFYFYDGSTLIATAPLDASYSGTATVTFPTAGTHNLTATFTGNQGDAPSTSAVLGQVVNKAATATSLAASPNPAYQAQNVVLTATVTGIAPSGSVTFKDGTTSLGTANVGAGRATLSTGFATAGAHSVTAVYSGDANNASSTSTAATQTVQARAATTTALSVSPAAITVGQASTLTATVTGGANLTGTVTFTDGATNLATPTLNAGAASAAPVFSTAGVHTLTATYSGNVPNSGSSSAAGAVTVNKKSTTTTLSTNPSPFTQGQTVTLTATVAGYHPSGTVTFLDGAASIGTATVSGSVATLTTSFALGNHNLSAKYPGDANNTASTSSSATAVALPTPPVSPTPVVNYEYDAQGNPTKFVQAPGVSGFGFTTRAAYDALNRTTNTTNAKSGVTQFGYNGREDLIQVTDPRNLITKYPRNGLGDATSLVSPDTGTATHTYDAAGNLLTRTDSRGALATYSYDALNRLTKIVYSKSGSTSLTYTWVYDQTGAGYANGIGRLTSTTHPAGSTQYAYDAQGRVLTDIQRVSLAAGANPAQVAEAVTYTYDTAGNVASILYPSGRKLSVTYTGGQVTSLALAKDASAAATTLISGIRWEPFGGPKTWLWQMASGTQAYDRVYDANGRLVRYRMGNSARDLAYDAADRIRSYTHYDATTASATPTLDQTFGYDELGRLTTIATSTASWTIGYDANGNRTGVTLNGTQSTYSTSATSNRLTSMTSPARSFGFDAAGNTTSDTAGYTATYDLSGRLATITKAGVTTTYSYNNAGQRVRKFSSTGASSTVLFAYDQNGQLIGEYDSTGTAIREYVWLGSTPIAMFTPDAVATNPPVVYYFHTDHLSTPRVVVDKNNAVRWRWLAEPFGTTAPETNPSGLGVFAQPLRFPGQYADQESGLAYNWFRSADFTTGRYAQSDPIGLAGGINTYSYVAGNPVGAFDPNGLDIEYANHEVGAGAYHSKFVITPDNQAEYANDPRFQNFDASGRRFATIGAGPNGYMVMESGVNRPRDVSMPDATRKKLDLPCQYVDEDAAIKNLFLLAANYNNHKAWYTLIPHNVFGMATGYNSNSFISGLGNAAGFNMPAPGATGQNTPGYQNVLPAWRFNP